MRTRAIAVVVACVAMFAGCTGGPPQGEPRTVHPEVVLHTDIKPVADEFPNLAGIEQVAWLEEVINQDPRVPGPSTYKFQALIYLDAAAKQKLKDAAADWKPVQPGWTAEVHSLLAPKITTPDSWVRSATYSKEFGSKNDHYRGGFTVNTAEGVLYFNGAS